MSEQRDELAQTIRAVTDLWDEPLDEVHDIPPLTNAVLAAGYRKPRTDGEREWGIAWSAQEENGTTACDNKGAAYRLRDKMRKVGWVAEVVSRPAFPWETEPEPTP